MISIINSYSLSALPDSVTPVVDSMVAKVRTDGHPGILSYEMFYSGAHNKVIGVFRYQDTDAWIGHHKLIKDWHEFV